MIRIIIILLLFTIYLYSIKFTFLPITGKQFIEVVGFVLFVVNRRHLNFIVYSKTFTLCILLVLWGGIVCVLNGTDQFIYFTTYLFAPIASFFGAYLLYAVSKSYIKSFDSLLRIITIVVACESILTVVIYFSPTIYNLVSSVQEFLLHEAHKGEFANMNRFIGIGNAAYFGVLPSCSLGIVSCSYLLAHTSNKNQNILYLLAFVTILSVSFLISRTSLLLSSVALLAYALYMRKRGSIKGIVPLSLIVAFVLVAISFAEYYLPENMIMWSRGAFDTNSSYSSTNILVEWWTTTRFSLKTLFVGDGLYTTAVGYYMKTDVGYFRQMYYGGIFGLFLVMMIHFSILKKIKMLNRNKNLNIYLYSLFACYCIIMAKGDMSMVDLFILLLVFIDYIQQEKKNNNGYRIKSVH